MSKQQELEAIRQSIIRDNVCPELAEQATQLVMGDGTPDAAIVLIGEAPGKKEDATGQPFVGASGRFLNELLAAAGLSREDVYITNIVKYRPPGNRDPRPAEKAAFAPYLVQQLEVIAPKVIVTLGRHSGMFFVPDLQISRDHGQPRRVLLGEANYEVVPLYHPAAALYNGSMRQTLLDDFTQLKQYI